MTNREQIELLQNEVRAYDRKRTEYIRATYAKQRRAAYIAIALALISITLSIFSISQVVVE